MLCALEEAPETLSGVAQRREGAGFASEVLEAVGSKIAGELFDTVRETTAKIPGLTNGWDAAALWAAFDATLRRGLGQLELLAEGSARVSACHDVAVDCMDAFSVHVYNRIPGRGSGLPKIMVERALELASAPHSRAHLSENLAIMS